MSPTGSPAGSPASLRIVIDGTPPSSDTYLEVDLSCQGEIRLLGYYRYYDEYLADEDQHCIVSEAAFDRLVEFVRSQRKPDGAP